LARPALLPALTPVCRRSSGFPALALCRLRRHPRPAAPTLAARPPPSALRDIPADHRTPPGADPCLLPPTSVNQ